MSTFTHIIVMLFDRGQEGEEEMRGIIDYSGEKSFVSFITHAGNGSVVVAVTESGTTSVKCLQTNPSNDVLFPFLIPTCTIKNIHLSVAKIYSVYDSCKANKRTHLYYGYYHCA